MNNMNPWIVEALVEYERDRIRRDMKQIRLEEEAMQAGRAEEKLTKARFYRPRLLMLIGRMLAKLRPLRMHSRKVLRYGGSTEHRRG